MSARRQIIAALSEDGLGGIATMEDVAHAEQLVDSHRTEVLTEGATELDRIADETEARVAEHYGAASGIGPGSAEMVREAARTLRSLSEEKASAPAPTATPEGPVFDPLPSYLHSIGQAGSETEQCLYAAYRQAIAEVARLQGEIADRNQPAVGEATPTDTNRRARLLHEMALGGRWKSGDVVRWYERTGITGLGVRAARVDLAILRDSGAITQHDEKGVRFYTLNTRKDSVS